MPYLVLATGVAVVHLAFVLFVVFGGVAVARWRRVAWVHVPCAVYGAMIMLTGWVCPLTPLENALRRAAGEPGYRGGFVEHYLLSPVWPAGAPLWAQWAMGLGVVAVNGAVYSWILLAGRARRAGGDRTRDPGTSS